MFSIVSSGFEPAGGLGPCLVDFACFSHACVGFLQGLQFSPTAQSYSKLPIDLHLSVNGCLSLF